MREVRSQKWRRANELAAKAAKMFRHQGFINGLGGEDRNGETRFMIWSSNKWKLRVLIWTLEKLSASPGAWCWDIWQEGLQLSNRLFEADFLAKKSAYLTPAGLVVGWAHEAKGDCLEGEEKYGDERKFAYHRVGGFLQGYWFEGSHDEHLRQLVVVRVILDPEGPETAALRKSRRIEADAIRREVNRHMESGGEQVKSVGDRFPTPSERWAAFAGVAPAQ